MNIKTIRIEIQKAALDLEVWENSKAIPDPLLLKLENLLRDLKLFSLSSKK